MFENTIEAIKSVLDAISNAEKNTLGTEAY